MNTHIILILLIISMIFCFIIIFISKSAFRNKQLKDKQGKCILSGQLKKSESTALLPVSNGRQLCNIKVHRGSLRLVHHSYNPDGGSWNLPPVNNERKFFDIDENGEFSCTIDIGESYGFMERLQVVNKSLFKSLEFSYKICGTYKVKS